jgi:hypothetical protein
LGYCNSILLIIIAIFFFQSRSESVVSDEDGTATENTVNTPDTGKKMAFSQFVKQGGTYKCTVSQTINNVETQGITYIKDNMMRGQYEMNVSGQTMTSNMLVKDGYTYMWGSNMGNMGFKMKVPTDTTANTPTTPTSGNMGGFNYDQVGDYSCDAWTADAKTFTVPTKVTFKEM